MMLCLIGLHEWAMWTDPERVTAKAVCAHTVTDVTVFKQSRRCIRCGIYEERIGRARSIQEE